ncbi:MAG: hypothetical protein ACJ74W_19340 [Pyrinomonadaceae bacterium]
MTSLTLVTTAHADANITTVALSAAAGARRASLPVLATANDVRELVQYLKKRPHGIDVSEIAQPIRKRIFFPPKIAAYEYWGLVTRTGERLTLTQFGREFAQRLDPEAVAYRALLDATSAYRAALARLYAQGSSVVTHEEVIACWRAHLPRETDETELSTLRAGVVCFFHLCQAAELGTMTLGKRGQPTRLRLLRTELKRHLETNRADTHDNSTTPRAEVDATSATTNLRVYVSHPAGAAVVEQLLETLRLADATYCLGERGATERAQTGAHVIAAMRACDLGIVVLGPEDFDEVAPNVGGTLAERVLNEIGTAFVCFDGRLLLLHEESLPLPAALQAFQCTFRGAELTWAGGMKLLRALKSFRAAMRPRSTAARR